MEEFIGLIFTILNPFVRYPLVIGYAYAWFFLANLALAIWALVKDVPVRKALGNCVRVSSGWGRVALAGILLFHLANLVFCAQPLNTITAPISEELFQSSMFSEHMILTRFEVPAGFSILLSFVTSLGLSTHVGAMAMGISFSCMIVIALWLAAIHITGKEIFGLAAAAIYASLSMAVQYAASFPNSIIVHAFFLLLFIFVLSASSKVRPALVLLATLLVYFRMEDVIFLVIPGLLILRSREYRYILLIYLFLLPHALPLKNYRIFINSEEGFVIGPAGVGERVLSLFSLMISELGILLFMGFLAGLLFLLYKKRFVLPSAFGLLIFVYLTFQTYLGIPLRYLSGLLPVIVLLAVAGLSWIAKPRLAMAASIAMIIVAPHHLFSQYPPDTYYVVPNLEASQDIDGCVLLAGYRDLVYNWKPFYGDDVVTDPFVFDENEQVMFEHPSRDCATKIYLSERTPDVDIVRSDGIVHFYR